MLYLFPNLLGDIDGHAQVRSRPFKSGLADEESPSFQEGGLQTHTAYLPNSVDAAVSQINYLIAESEKEGRRFLRRFTFNDKTFRDIPIRLLNEHSNENDKKTILKEMMQGGKWGLVSDCGMPCLADPGADLVLMARENGIPIETFAGPSSVLFALVLSGLGGQRFMFHGYLPKEEDLLLQELKSIEKISSKEKSTHLFIETPYRNHKLLEKILNALHAQTWLCIACDLTLPSQFVQTKQLKNWNRNPLPDLNKRPTVFVLRSCMQTSF